MEQIAAKDEIEIDLSEIVRLLLSKLWLIILFGIIFGIGSLIISKYVMAPVYSSSTGIYVLSRQDNLEGSQVTYAALQTGSQLTKDYLILVKSRTVLTRVISDLQLDLTTEDLSEMISVSTPPDTRIITITVNSVDAYQAQRMANAVREVASEHIQNVMNLEAVNVVDEADIPLSPTSPNTRRNTLLGVIAGMFIAVAIVVARFILDDSIKVPDDVEKYMGLSVLGSIPQAESERKRRKHKETSDQAPEIINLEKEE